MDDKATDQGAEAEYFALKILLNEYGLNRLLTLSAVLGASVEEIIKWAIESFIDSNQDILPSAEIQDE